MFMGECVCGALWSRMFFNVTCATRQFVFFFFLSRSHWQDEPRCCAEPTPRNEDGNGKAGMMNVTLVSPIVSHVVTTQLAHVEGVELLSPTEVTCEVSFSTWADLREAGSLRRRQLAHRPRPLHGNRDAVTGTGKRKTGKEREV